MAGCILEKWSKLVQLITIIAPTYLTWFQSRMPSGKDKRPIVLHMRAQRMDGLMVLLWCLNLRSSWAITTVKWTNRIWGVVHCCPYAKYLSQLHQCEGQCSLPLQVQERACCYKELYRQKWRWCIGYLPKGLLIQRNVRTVISGKLYKSINQNAPSMSLIKLFLRLVLVYRKRRCV